MNSWQELNTIAADSGLLRGSCCCWRDLSYWCDYYPPSQCKRSAMACRVSGRLWQIVPEAVENQSGGRERFRRKIVERIKGRMAG